tara:strand:+ start:219 stop:491 length:273 start_codon:yes stop_codon:yes gene_type:complete
MKMYAEEAGKERSAIARILPFIPHLLREEYSKYPKPLETSFIRALEVSLLAIRLSDFIDSFTISLIIDTVHNHGGDVASLDNVWYVKINF